MARILIICDHKWRDLPNLVVLKVGLEKKGNTVLIADAKNYSILIKTFQAQVVIFNHLHGSRLRAYVKTLKKDGVKIILLPTEGSTKTDYENIIAGKYTDLNLCDLILPWNQKNKDNMVKIGRVDKNKIKVCGYNRLDFYSKDYNSLIKSKKDFLKFYKIKENKPIYTWATQYGYADLGLKINEEKFKQLKHEIKSYGVEDCLKNVGLTLKDHINFINEDRRRSSNSFFETAKNFPNIQFLIKPHPTEDRIFYQQNIERFSLNNVNFINHGYIWDVLNVTDVEMHRHCTTAVEAWEWDIPTIEMNMNYQDVGSWPERQQGSYEADNTSELKDIVNHTLKDKEIPENIKKKRLAHTKTEFSFNDGKNNLRSIKYIQDFINKTDKKNNQKFFLKKNSTKQFGYPIIIRLLVKEFFLKINNFKKKDQRDKYITQIDILNFQKLVRKKLYFYFNFL